MLFSKNKIIKESMALQEQYKNFHGWLYIANIWHWQKMHKLHKFLPWNRSSIVNSNSNPKLCIPLSVSSSFVQGLSISVQPLKPLLSSVRSTAACGLPSWHTRSSDEKPRLGFLNDSGKSFSGHSQTLQSRRRHIPSSGQKGQSHHNLTWHT